MCRGARPGNGGNGERQGSGTGDWRSAAFVAGFAALFLFVEAPAAQGFAAEDHEDDGGHDDGDFAGGLHNAGGDEESGGDGGGLAGAEQEGSEDGDGGRDGSGPDAQIRNAGGGDGMDTPGVSSEDRKPGGGNAGEVADEDAVGTGAAAVRGLDELVGGGAEAGKDEGLAGQPSGERGDEDEESFTSRSYEEIAFVHRPSNGMQGDECTDGRRCALSSGTRR